MEARSQLRHRPTSSILPDGGGFVKLGERYRVGALRSAM